MLEIAEAIVIARQVTETLSGKRIERVVANHSPRQFAWFYDNSEAYDSALSGSDLLSPPPRRFEPDLAGFPVSGQVFKGRRHRKLDRLSGMFR